MKLPGVESADVSLEQALADITLKPDNRITIPQLRELLKKNGYPTRDAEIEARGRIVERAGKMVLDLLNGSTLEIEAKGVALMPADGPVEIRGVSRASAKRVETLAVTSVR